jgi:hypothetical protein
MTARSGRVKQFTAVKLDRLQLFAGSLKTPKPPEIDGYRTINDRFVRSQTTTKAFRRCRECFDSASGTQIFIQYEPQLPSLPAFKLTIVPDDRTGLSRKGLSTIAQAFDWHQVLLVELSLDFSPESGVDYDFVLRCAKFGKSRLQKSRPYSRSARYGARHGDKLARCYYKDNLSVLRVELQLHSRFLRQQHIAQIEDLSQLPAALFPKHLKFVQLDWDALNTHLSKKHLGKRQIARRLRKEAASLPGAMHFLRSQAGVRNPHRFLKQIAPSKAVQELIEEWAADF